MESAEEVKQAEEHGSIASGLPDPVKKDPAQLSCCETVKSMFTLQRTLVLLIYVVLIGACIFVVGAGYIDDVGDFAENAGVGGQVVFVLLVMLIVQPFGWGYTPCEILLGFIYGWYGLVLLLIGAILGSTLSFLYVREFGVACCDESISKLDPKKQLFITKLNTITAKRNLKSYAIMIGSRQTPLPFGITTFLLALTHVGFIDFFVTLVLGIMCEAPLGINLGVILSKSEEIINNDGGDSNVTNSEEDDFQKIQVAVSTSITLFFFFLSAIYGRYVWKQISGDSNENIMEQINALNTAHKRKRRNEATDTTSEELAVTFPSF